MLFQEPEELTKRNFLRKIFELKYTRTFTFINAFKCWLNFFQKKKKEKGEIRIVSTQNVFLTWGHAKNGT